MTDTELAVRFRKLSRGEQISQLAKALHDSVKESLRGRHGHAMRRYLMSGGDLESLGAEAQAAQQDAMTSLLAPLASALGPTLSKITQPAVEKATASLQPVLKQELAEQAPNFAIIVGALLGLFTLGGILFAKKFL